MAKVGDFLGQASDLCGFIFAQVHIVAILFHLAMHDMNIII